MRIFFVKVGQSSRRLRMQCCVLVTWEVAYQLMIWSLTTTAQRKKVRLEPERCKYFGTDMNLISVFRCQPLAAFLRKRLLSSVGECRVHGERRHDVTAQCSSAFDKSRLPFECFPVYMYNYILFGLLYICRRVPSAR